MKLSAFLVLLPALFSLSAAAAELPEHDGYLFRLNEGQPVSLSSIPDGVEPVSAEIGIFKADSLDDISAFASGDQIRYVEPNYIVTLFDAPVSAAPDDPRYPQQWGLEMLGAENAWGIGLDGTGVRIGVIDSGIFAAHEDLVGANIGTGYNYIDQNEDTSDDVGHGTFVSGVISAVPNNGTGISGLAPGAELIPLKCFNSKRSTIADIVNGITGGTDAGCDILNMSLGTTEESQALKEAIDYADSKGVILVAAVGNSGGSTLNYPAAYENVIGVGMINSTKTVAPLSQRNDSVFVTAPGYDVLGLGYTTAELYRPGSGTSFSAPHISAIAALLKQKDPSLNTEGFMELLLLAAEDLGAPGYDVNYGYGLPSIPALLQLLDSKEDLLPFRLTQTEDQLLIQGRSSLAEEAVLFAAAYLPSGQLLQCEKLSYETFRNPAGNTSAVLLLNSAIAIDPETEQLKLLFLNAETFAPFRPAALWKP